MKSFALRIRSNFALSKRHRGFRIRLVGRLLPVRRLSFVFSVGRLVFRRCHIISTFHRLLPAPRRTVRAQLTHTAPQTIIRGLAPMRSSFVSTASPLLCAAGVSLLCSTICRLLPSGGITRLHWYYETIRLPAAVLPSSLCAVVGHTLGLSPLTALSCSLRKQRQGLPGCRAV